MSDYKRFVSYLYEYIAEKKSENRGFVKVELRSGICRMQFQLNVFSLPSQTPVTVYGFIQIGTELQGFPLGQITSGKNGISGILTFPSRKQLLYLKETDPRLRLMMQFYQKLHLTLMSLMNPKLLPPRIPQLRQTP